MDLAQATRSQKEAVLARFIEELVQEIRPLHLRHNEAVWKANTTGEARYVEEGARIETQIRTIFSRADSYQRLRDLALAAKMGGVGYYEKSDFVHLDTGSFRTWEG